MRRPEGDPPRWSQARGDVQPPERDIGQAFQREPAAALSDAALARIGRTVFAARQPERRPWWALRASFVAAVLLFCTGGVVVAARLAWRPRETQSVVVPAHSSVTVTGRHHRRLTLLGPATLALEPNGPGRGADVALANGTLTVEAGGEPLSVSAGAVTVTVPADAAGEIQAAADKAPAVRALAGQLRLHRENSADVSVSPEPPTAPAATVTAIAAAAPVPRPIAADAPGPSSSVSTASPALAGARPIETSHAIQPARPTAAGPSTFKPAPPAEPRPIATEATLLAAAFRKLRTDGDAAGALGALDDYDRAYPTGWLRGEAAVARAEALLMLGRSTDALPLLENAGSALTRNLRTARGELFAKADRCDRAGEDFSDVLLADQNDALAERALAGRAACRLRSGQADQARGDLRRYLELFPRGPRADEARRLLSARR